MEITVAAEITGHNVTTMIAHYRRVTAVDKRAAMEKARLGEVPALTVLKFEGEK